MVLLRCYVENFGTLENFSLDFNQGLNTVNQENGWGKSTLAAFIKAMFFGLEYNARKQTERDRYLPWSNGRYGGMLEFQIEDKKYRVERYFGKKDKEDTFSLLDLSTNKKSDDFTENLGEEVWEVDKLSFENSLFISLQDTSRNTLLTDLMSSKLSDVKDLENDVNRFESASKKLDVLATRLKAKKGKGGEINELAEEIQVKKRNVTEADDTIRFIELKQKEIQNIQEEILQEKQALVNVHKKIRLHEKAVEKSSLQRMEEGLSKLKDQINQKHHFFKGQVPTEIEIQENFDRALIFEREKENLNEKSLTYLEVEEHQTLTTYFSAGLPDKKEIDNNKEKVVEYRGRVLQEQETKLSEKEIQDLRFLTDMFEFMDDPEKRTGEEIKKYRERESLEMEIQRDKEQLENLEIQERKKKKEKGRKTGVVLLTAGIVLLLLGLTLTLFFNAVLPGVVVIVVSFAVMVSAILFFRKKSVLAQGNATSPEVQKLAKEMLEKEKKSLELQQEYLHFIRKHYKGNEDETLNILFEMKGLVGRYRELLEKRRTIQNNQAKLKETNIQTLEEIREFLHPYMDSTLISDFSLALEELEKKLERFGELKKKKEQEKETEEKKKKAEEKIVPFVLRYFSKEPEKLMNAINEIRDQYLELLKLQESLEIEQKEFELFKKEHNIENINQFEIPEESLEELEIIQKEINAGIDGKSSQIGGLERDIYRLSEIADGKEDLEAEILELEEKKEELERKYKRILLAKEGLEEAKEALSARYLGKIDSSFQKYTHMLRGGKGNDLKIDTELNVSEEVRGSLYDISYLSHGNRDLVNFCIRMSLIDAVYKDVTKPFIIMDDPFYNFDNPRIDNSLEFLNEIAEEYQIIYFTCHDSRSVSG